MTAYASQPSPAPQPARVCEVCAGALTTQFTEADDPQSGRQFAILRCGQCGLGHTSPAPDEAEMAAFYRDYHGGRHGFSAVYCARRRMRFVRQMVAEPRGRRLLDVGCGDGTFLLAAQAAGWQVTGTEMNTAAARSLGLQVYSGLQEIHGLAPFECITLWHTLEHMRDPHRVIASLRALLSPSGALLIAVPDAGGWQARIFGARWFHLDVPRHLFHFTHKSLAHLVYSCGFTPARQWRQEFEYDALGWSQSALNISMSPSNLFFDLLRGRKPAAGALKSAAAFAAGLMLTAAATPLVPLSSLCSRGGTLVMAARPEISGPQPKNDPPQSTRRTQREAKD
ncbi:MAG TPA: class I SAM-dependent methyltransferase [Candidatus Saccharimonadales bacterium]|jgi:SAM-dependent methyltransferase|nr:class I SAM-dependent methyltransferase [Candidatus Saccharimonadales bacterium]